MSDGDGSLAVYVGEHACRALDGILRVGAELPVEIVHGTRTSLRRLRAAVRTVPGAVPDAAAADAALQALALPLGEVRDADVLAALLASEAEDLEPGPARSAAQALLEDELRSRRRDALAAVEAAAGTGAWREGAALLEAWCRTPPSLPVPAAEEVLDRAERKVVRRLETSGGQPSRLHAARKAAKRWRYAAELLAAAPDDAPSHEHIEAARVRAEAMQDLLGGVQDLEIAHGLLTELVTAADDGSPARTGLEQLRTRLSARQRELIARAVASS